MYKSCINYLSSIGRTSDITFDRHHEHIQQLEQVTPDSTIFVEGHVRCSADSTNMDRHGKGWSE